MIDACAAQRVGTSDEIAEAAAFLLGEHAKFITSTVTKRRTFARLFALLTPLLLVIHKTFCTFVAINE